MTAGKSVPEKAQAEGQVSRQTPFEKFVSAIRLEAEMADQIDEGTNIAADVVSRILEAESLDEAFAAQDAGLKNGKDFVDVEIVVQDFLVRTSETKYNKEGSLGVYVRVSGARLDNGESFQFFTGAPNVVALLWKARNDNHLPLECRIQSKETANGELLTLRPLPKRVVRGN